VEFEFKIGRDVHKISIEKKDEYFVTKVNNRTFKVVLVEVGQNTMCIMIDGQNCLAYIAESEGGKYVWIGGEMVIVEEVKEEGAKRFVSQAEASGSVQTPIPGVVKKVMVKEGDKVEAGQSLFVIEAMKMENDIKSPVKGIVKKVSLKVNELVEAFKTVVIIEPAS
jgi:biotin carboxyl carrier protein